MKIAAIVIVYHPDENELVNNILSYIENVDLLIVWDNTQKGASCLPLNALTSYQNKIKWLGESENRGIGYALNIAAQNALINKYDWLLTMDQDSSFEGNLFFEQFHQMEKENLGIVSPVHHISKFNVSVTLPHIIDIIATSGNLVNLEKWKLVGGFDEGFFIDEVDHDFCLKLKERGVKVVEFKNILLNHQLGNITTIKTLRGNMFTFSLHSPLRTYYIFRNGLYMLDKYKNRFPELEKQRKRMLKIELKHIILYSDKKFQKLGYALRGFFDYHRRIIGPYSPLIKK